jgi:GrpB-like predicted nucleotidyltransferase (UPF0157 family)
MRRHPSLDDRFDPAVRLVAHDPGWGTQAAQELHRVKDALGPIALRLEHVGSTAVPGLAAKPIVDLLVSVGQVDPHGAHVERLEGLGYLFVPDPDSADFQLFARPPERPRTHHLHVCEAGSLQETRHLAVRDFLRTHAAEALGYERLKRELVQRAPGDRLAYIEGKRQYVDRLEARALIWAASRQTRPA